MATVLQLADYAGVSAEQVLRVVNGEPISGDVAARVRDAIEALGPPPYPGADVEVLPATTPVTRARESLSESLARATAQLESTLPSGVGSVVYEALRVEVRPVAEHVSHVGRLVDELVTSLQGVRGDADLQRQERIEDLQLLIELVTSGWRGVDRRLGRLERMVERLQAQPNGAARTNGRTGSVDRSY